jgi:hypothetical protein
MVLASAEDVTAAATLGLLIVACIAGFLAYRQLRESRKLREAQAQPYVAVFADTNPSSAFVIDLVVRNFGQTAAKDIRILFNPAPMRQAGTETGELVELPGVIPTLVPGQEWRTLWDTTMARAQSDLPKVYEISVAFEDSWSRPYNLQSRIDWDPLINRDVVTSHSLHDAVEALKEIASTVKGWNEGRGPGLSVLARDGEKADARREEWREQRKREQERRQHEDET